jgi:hypothetical protein
VGKRVFHLPFCAALICGFFLFSCIGTGADISLRQNGSGSIKLEYRLAKDLESLGKFDGNERWLPVPAGKADLERSVNRIRGLKLKSFTSREDGRDLVHIAQLDFDNTEALAAFLDSTGQQVRVDLNSKRMTFSFPAMASENGEFTELFTEALSGYFFTLSFTLPGKAQGRWLNQGGSPLSAGPAQLSIQGNTAALRSPMADMIFPAEGAVLEISW